MSLKRRRDSGVSFDVTDMPRFKRRRFTVRPRRRRGRRGFRRKGRQGFATTTRWGRPHSTNYRGKKTSVRRWRNILWRDTQAKMHYRSLNSSNQGFFGPALGTPNTSAIILFPALQVTAGVFRPDIGVGGAFWEIGVQSPDIGEPIPTFRGDITIRGGIARVLVGAYPDNVPLRVRIYAIWANANPDIDVYTAMNNTNQQVEWDPSLIGEFSTKFGKILYMKEALVPVGESMEVVHRFKPQKIDKAVFRGEPAVAGVQPAEPAGNTLWWAVVVVPLDTNAVTAGITCVSSYSLSFCGDGT